MANEKQSHVGQAQISDKLFEPFILLTQLLDFLAGRFAFGVPAQPVLARLHEILQPLNARCHWGPLLRGRRCDLVGQTCEA